MKTDQLIIIFVSLLMFLFEEFIVVICVFSAGGEYIWPDFDTQ